MRTSIDISDSLLARARKVMAKKRVTLRSLVEEGLRRVLDEDPRTAAFEPRDARFDGPTGFAPGATEADVSAAIRELNESASLP